VPRPTATTGALNAANPSLFGSWFHLTQRSGLALSSGPSWVGVSLAFYLMIEADPASETFFLILYCERWTMGAVKKLSDWKCLFSFYFHALPLCSACNDVMYLKHSALMWNHIFTRSFRLWKTKFLKPNTHIVLLVAGLSTDQVCIVSVAAYDTFTIYGIDCSVRCTLWAGIFTVCRRTRVSVPVFIVRLSTKWKRYREGSCHSLSH
jgi:hypothetical protein